MARVTLLTGGNLGDVSSNMAKVVGLLSARFGGIVLISCPPGSRPPPT